MKSLNLTGQKFGRLTVIRRTKRLRGQIAWLCKCECGNLVSVVTGSLNRGATRSCGCFRRELSKMKKTSHGLSVDECGRKTRLFVIWKGMRQRCYNKNHPAYCCYGGRGINICEDWDDFAVFHAWAMANGYRNDLTIERIDNDGNYDPRNCRWATRGEQSRNNRNNHLLTFNGQTKLLTDWSIETGIGITTIISRLEYLRWSVEKTLTTPIGGDDCARTSIEKFVPS